MCYGYATAFNAILQIKDIPCVFIASPNHAWSMAYNGERWMLIDTTWMSSGKMLDGVLHKNPYIRKEWFDYTIDKANADPNHVIEEADYTEYNNCIFAFPKYTSCKKFEIPQNIIGVEDFAFYSCVDIDITFDGAFESVGEAAFYKCNKFDGTLNLKNIRNIGMWAFDSCASIDAVYIGENITALPYAAFYGCTSLQKVFLDKNVKTIEDMVFANCFFMKYFYYNGTTEEFNELLKSTGLGNNFKRFAITDYKPAMKVSSYDSIGKKCNVEYVGIPFGETVLFAEYCNGKILKIKSGVLDDALTYTAEEPHTDEIKVFVWKDFHNPLLLCESQNVSFK